MAASESGKRARTDQVGAEGGSNLHVSDHPLIAHKVTQLRKADLSTREFQQLMKEVSTLVLYEATHRLKLCPASVDTEEDGLRRTRTGQKLTERLGVVPILRGGLGMAEAATEMVPTAQVWHLGIYRDKSSLLPVEYYNKLPKKVSVERVFLLDPMPISGSTAVAALDILKAWGATAGHPFAVELVSIVATAAAVKLLAECHPDVPLHIGIVDDSAEAPLMPSLGDVGDRLFNTF